MISTKELSYVNLWANRVPYPGEEYAVDALTKVQDCVSLFLDNYDGKFFSLTRSDNTELHFEILQKNLCHMLGIDYKNLTSEFFSWYRMNILGMKSNEMCSSFEFLMRIFENFDRVIDYDINNSARALNYYKLVIKADIFSKLPRIENMDFGCINFNKDIFAQKTNSNVAFNSTTLLYFPSDEVISPYYFMGLIQENDSDSLVVETMFLPENFSYYLFNQEVTIPTQLLINNADILNKKQNSPENKIRLISEYVKLLSLYDLPNCLNINGDYMSLLSDAARNNCRVR